MPAPKGRHLRKGLKVMQMNIGPGSEQGGAPFGHHIITESCTDLRSRGRAALAGKWTAAVITVILFLILVQTVPSILDLFFGKERIVDVSQYLGQGAEDLLGGTQIKVKQSPVSSLYTFLVMPPLTYGITMYFLDTIRNKACSTTDIFQGFEKFLKVLLLSVYMYIFVFLWALIPIAGIFLAIRAAIRYSMAYAVLCDQPDLPVSLCVEESKRLMEGNKMRYLLLNLSFIGWYALAVAAVAVIAFLCSLMFFPLAGTAFGVAVIKTIASAAGMIPVAIPTAYCQATNIAFYELAGGRISGETAFVRDM